MVDFGVLLCEVRGGIGAVWEEQRPDFGADGGAHAVVEEVVAPAAGRGGDAMGEVVQGDRVLIAAVRDAFEPCVAKIAGRERRALSAHGVEPDEL